MESDKRVWIQTVMSEYETPLIRYALRFIGDLEMAKEIVQDTFLKLWAHDRTSVQGHLRPWLYSVTRNRALDHLRKKGRAKEYETETHQSVDPDMLADEMISQDQTAQKVNELVESLPPRHKEVLLLKFQEDLSYKDISNITGHSVSYVGVLIHEAVKKLRSQIMQKDDNVAELLGARNEP